MTTTTEPTTESAATMFTLVDDPTELLEVRVAAEMLAGQLRDAYAPLVVLARQVSELGLKVGRMQNAAQQRAASWADGEDFTLADESRRIVWVVSGMESVWDWSYKLSEVVHPEALDVAEVEIERGELNIRVGTPVVMKARDEGGTTLAMVVLATPGSPEAEMPGLYNLRTTEPPFQTYLANHEEVKAGVERAAREVEG